jgi:hypothetical protein
MTTETACENDDNKINTTCYKIIITYQQKKIIHKSDGDDNSDGDGDGSNGGSGERQKQGRWRQRRAATIVTIAAIATWRRLR